MIVKGRFLLVAVQLLALVGMGERANGMVPGGMLSDGMVVLKGTIEQASADADVLSFAFSGRVAFTFYAIAPLPPEGIYEPTPQGHIEIDVKQLPIRVPFFGTHEYDNENDPYRVTYKMAVQNASEASKSGEAVSIMLSEPSLSFDNGGVIQRIDCKVGQVFPDRLERQLREGTPGNETTLTFPKVHMGLVVGPNEAKTFPQGPRGVLMNEVLPDSPGDRAGIKQGDVILKFNEHEINSEREIVDLMNEVDVGATVLIMVLRNSEFIPLSIHF